jgi:hypothetical protein
MREKWLEEARRTALRTNDSLLLSLCEVYEDGDPDWLDAPTIRQLFDLDPWIRTRKTPKAAKSAIEIRIKTCHPEKR